MIECPGVVECLGCIIVQLEPYFLPVAFGCLLLHFIWTFFRSSKVGR